MSGWRLPGDDVELVDTMPGFGCLHCDKGWGECSCTCPEDRFQWEPVKPDPRGFVQRRRVFAAGRIESGRLVSLVCDQTAGGFEAVDSPTPAVLNTVEGPVRALYFETRGRVATGAVRRVLEEALDPAAALVHAQTFGVRGVAGATLETRR